MARLIDDVLRKWRMMDLIAGALKEYREEDHPRDDRGRWTDVGGGSGGSDTALKVQHRKYLPFSDAPGEKYIRFGKIPKGEQSTVGQAPNWIALVTGEAAPGAKLSGVSVYAVKFNKIRNLWQIDSSNLTEGGFASVDELIANQDSYTEVMVSGGHSTDPATGKQTWSPPVYEWKKRKNIRPIFLVSGKETDDEGTDGEPLLHDIKILDQLLIQDVLHEGYFDPDIDLNPKFNPEAFGVTHAQALAHQAAERKRRADALKTYDESEHPRDEIGRWTDAAGNGNAGGGDGESEDSGDQVRNFESMFEQEVIARIAPEGFVREKYPVVQGVRQSSQGECTRCALDEHINSKAEVHVGAAVRKDRYKEVKEQFGKNGLLLGSETFPHAWNVRGGRIVDHALGSQLAKEHLYFGVRVPDDELQNIRSDVELTRWHISKVKKPTKAIEQELLTRWNEADHPREPGGSPEGGQFTEDGGTTQDFTREDDKPSVKPPFFNDKKISVGPGVSKEFHLRVIAAANGMGPPEFLDRIRRLHARYVVEVEHPESPDMCLAEYTDPVKEGGWNQIKIYERPLKSKSDESLSRTISHEVGHAIDQSRDYSNGAQFAKALEADMQHHTLDQIGRWKYYRGNHDWMHPRGEPFAESVSVLVGPQTEESRAFRTAFPRTVALVEKRLRSWGALK